jgi:nickel-dependent lactate racemase
MIVLDREGRIHAAAAGDLHGTLHAVVPAAERIYAPTVESRERIVVAAVSPPLDLNLYQAQKALEHGILALEDGGTLILVSPCHEGLGDDTFARALSTAASPEGALGALPDAYRFGDHKVARIARAVMRFEIVAVTELEPDLVASLFMLPAPDLQTALDAALTKHPDGRVLVMPRAAETAPRLA